MMVKKRAVGKKDNSGSGESSAVNCFLPYLRPRAPFPALGVVLDHPGPGFPLHSTVNCMNGKFTVEQRGSHDNKRWVTGYFLLQFWASIQIICIIKI